MRAGPFYEQLDGIRTFEVLDGTGVVLRQAERGQAVDLLTPNLERFAGGGQEPHVGASAVELLGQLGGAPDDVFAIVHDDEGVLGGQGFAQDVEGRPARLLAHPQR
jgi:hypothetical protein